MPATPENFFRYFTPPPELLNWGLSVTACGWARIEPNAPYPQPAHPEEYQFNWQRGRILDCLHVALISAGRGVIETEGAGLRVVEAGSAFLLLPRVWHRYRPNPETGWIESWAEIRGPLLENILSTHAFGRENELRSDGFAAGLDLSLDAIHVRARAATSSFNPEFCALGMGLLATWARAGSQLDEGDAVSKAVAEAERILEERHTESINIAALARTLGAPYSPFRREFKRRTGFSPWQYVVHIRLCRARRLLSATDLPLAVIAEKLGFSSAFHLSLSFKQTFGVSPLLWKRQLRSQQPTPIPQYPRSAQTATE